MNELVNKELSCFQYEKCSQMTIPNLRSSQSHCSQATLVSAFNLASISRCFGNPMILIH
jgi:hypothetical protein